MEEFINEELKEIEGLLPKGYYIKDLNEVDKDIVWNLAYMVLNAQADDTDECDGDSLLTKMVKEIKRETEEEIRLNLRIDAARFVTSRLDSYEVDAEG